MERLEIVITSPFPLASRVHAAGIAAKTCQSSRWITRPVRH